MPPSRMWGVRVPTDNPNDTRDQRWEEAYQRHRALIPPENSQERRRCELPVTRAAIIQELLDAWAAGEIVLPSSIEEGLRAGHIPAGWHRFGDGLARTHEGTIALLGEAQTGPPDRRDWYVWVTNSPPAPDQDPEIYPEARRCLKRADELQGI